LEQDSKGTGKKNPDKIWEMQRTRILDKIQRLLDQTAPRIATARALHSQVQSLISWRREEKEPFTQEDAQLCEDSLAVLKVDIIRGEALLAQWGKRKV
jgi:hypothetical protein